MSTTTISKRFKVDTVLTDPTSIVLQNWAATYGVRRKVGGEVVVAAGTAMTQVATGRYTYSFTDPAPNLTYDYAIRIVYNGEVYIVEGEIQGGTETTADLYDLTHRVTPHVPGVEQLLLKQQMRALMQDFCRQTEIWKSQLASIASEIDEDEYELTTNYDAFIHRVTAVELDSVAVEYDSVSEDGVTLTLTTAPVEDDLDIDVWVTLIPLENCTDYPTWLINRWGEAIVNGTIARLKAMDMPWRDPNGVQLYDSMYRYAIGEAKRETITKRGPADIQITPRVFV